jgi:two-component system NtrC family sensor kinase
MTKQKPSGPHVILVVEPNRTLASLVSSVLGKEGYTIVTAGTSEEALELCESVSDISLLISDVRLPDGSGIDLGNRISRSQPKMKLLFISSISEEKLRDQGIPDEAHVLEKPIALSDLISRVNQLLHKR